HQQLVAVAQVVGQGVKRRPAAIHHHAEDLTDRRGDEVWIADRGQRHERDAVLKLIEHLGGDLRREARLAGATRSHQRDEPGIRAEQQLVYGRALVLSADQGATLDRQVVRAGGQAAQGRESGGQAWADDLEDVLYLDYVAQTVLAQIEQLDVWWQVLGDEIA